MGFHVDTTGNVWLGTGSTGTTLANAITAGPPNFYVTTTGSVYAAAGTIGGIDLASTYIQSSNYSDTSGSEAGFKIQSNGDAFFNKVSIRVNASSDNSPSDTQNIGFGVGSIYGNSSSNDLVLSAPQIAITDSSGTPGATSGTLIFTDGTYSNPGFYAEEDNAGQRAEFYFTNGTHNIFHTRSGLNTLYLDATYLSVYDGIGNNGQVLTRTSNGLEWTDQSGSSHADGDHTSFAASGHNHDSDYMSAGDTSHATHVSYGGSGGYYGDSSTVARSNHSHASSGGVTSISAGGSGMTGAVAFTSTGSGFFDTISQDTQQVKFTRSGVSSVKLRPASSSATYGLGDSTYRWLILYSQFASNTSSDENLKENIAVSDLGLDFINDLQPKKFTYIRQFGWVCENTEEQVEAEDSECNSCDEDTDCNVKWVDVTGIEEDAISYGLIAQDVEALQPEGTNWNLVRGEGDETKSLAYSEFISPLVKAVQELSTQVLDLTARVEALEG